MHVHTDTACSPSVDFYILYNLCLRLRYTCLSHKPYSLPLSEAYAQTSYTNHTEFKGKKKKKDTTGAVVSSLLVPPYTLQTLNIKAPFERNSDTGFRLISF